MIENLIRRLKETERGLTQRVTLSIKDNEALLLDMNTEDQLSRRGETSEGVSIASYDPYSPLTVVIKRAKGQPTGMVTLKDTGAFHRSFSIRYGDDAFEIYATDGKTRDLVARYGEDIFGLTDENLQEFIRVYLLPDLIAYVKEA